MHHFDEMPYAAAFVFARRWRRFRRRETSSPGSPHAAETRPPAAPAIREGARPVA